MSKRTGAGGTEGGEVMYWVGLGLAVLAIVFFFNSVYATTGMGFIRGMFHGRGGHGGGGGFWETTSMGLLFVPFLIAAIALFYDARKTWAWVLLYIGIGILVMEILSSLRFDLRMKVSSLLICMLIFAAGVGLMLRSYWPVKDHSKIDK